MNYYGKNSLSKVLDILLNLVLIFGIFMTIYVYYQTFYLNEIGLKGISLWISGILMTIGIGSLFVMIYQLKVMVKTLINSNPFVWENVRALNKIYICSFIVAGCYLVNYLFNIKKASFILLYVDKTGIHTEVAPIIFLLAGFFILILSKVFKDAVIYKEENDLTI